MTTEDATDLEAIEAEVLAGTVRSTNCGVCEWIASRPTDEQAVWDRLNAKPPREAAHTAIWQSMTARGLAHISVKPLERHRRGRHRVD